MANANVHTGFWVDHSKGRVLGSTITLEAKYGSQLVSAAAILVQLIGIATWTIVAFIIHQRRAKPTSRDEFEAQVQVTLRNTAGAESATWNFMKLWHAWKGRRSHLSRDIGALTALPAVIYIAFLVAGIFVGQIATNTYSSINVLLGNGTCGYIDHAQDTISLASFDHVSVNVSTVARQYAQSCYAESVGGISCSVYTVPRLDYSTMQNEPCPVPGSDVCFNHDTTGAPITLKTKVIDSHNDLGINAPVDDRLTYQYQATCAPLQYDFVDGLIAEATTNDGLALPVEAYMIGPLASTDGLLDPPYFYAPVMQNLSAGVIGYSVNAFSSLFPNDGSESVWTPVAPFNKTAGDLSVVLSAPNGIAYNGPVEDPMFRTYAKANRSTAYSYLPARNVYLLACSEHWQICNPQSSKCTGWNTTVNLADHQNIDHWNEFLDLNEQQNATFFRLANMPHNANIYSAVSNIPDPLLASSYFSSNAGSQALPDGFWKQEVEGWFQAVLAKLQYLQVVYANIPLSIVEANHIQIIEPDTQAARDQCHQQRISAPAQYQSYNFFALVLIAVFGIVIPGIAIVIKGLHHKLPFVNPRGYRYVSYQTEGLLQLHRLALEGSGYGGWENGMKDIPTTERARRRIPQAVLEDDEVDGRVIGRYTKREEGDDVSDGSTKADNTGYQQVEKEDSF